MSGCKSHRQANPESHRLFLCDYCGSQVEVCTPCDRRHSYCGSPCARAARAISHREANHRYQATDRGRKLHAERQARYRERQRSKQVTGRTPHAGTQVCERRVTDHTSHAAYMVSTPRPKLPRGYCSFCGAGPVQFHHLRPIHLPRKAGRQPPKRM